MTDEPSNKRPTLSLKSRLTAVTGQQQRAITDDFVEVGPDGTPKKPATKITWSEPRTAFEERAPNTIDVSKLPKGEAILEARHAVHASPTLEPVLLDVELPSTVATSDDRNLWPNLDTGETYIFDYSGLYSGVPRILYEGQLEDDGQVIRTDDPALAPV